MAKLPLRIEDLSPEEAVFELSSYPGQKFTLRRWSLRARAWAFSKFGAEKLQEIFQKQEIIHIAALAFFLLKEKEILKTEDDFMEAVVSTGDMITLNKALLKTVGIGEPEIKKITDAHEKNLAKAGESADPKRRRLKNP